MRYHCAMTATMMMNLTHIRRAFFLLDSTSIPVFLAHIRSNTHFFKTCFITAI